MTKPILPFPLAWPTSQPRTIAANRRRSQFGSDHAGDVSLATARAEVIDELARLSATDVVVTSDLPTRRDDIDRVPAGDVGIAVWFCLDGEQRVIANDRWASHAENLRAIAKTVEAMRGLARWGAVDVVERACAGFAALPAGETAASATLVCKSAPAMAASAKRPVIVSWRKTLDAEHASDNLEAVRACYRRQIKIVHTDRGGSAELTRRVNAAWEAAKFELGANAAGVRA